MPRAAQNDRPSMIRQVRERVQEFLLKHSLGLKEINVINDQNIDSTKPLPKTGKRMVAKSLGKIIAERLCRNQQNVGGWLGPF